MISTNRLFLLILFALSFGFSASAQYHPFIEPGKTWREKVESSSGLWYLDEYQLTGDTVINMETYKKLEMISSTDSGVPLPYYSGAVREDVAAKRVYIIFPGESTELLLYDFDLEVGEQHTFHYCYHYNIAPPGSIPGTFTVDSIGVYTDANGDDRTVWYLNYQHYTVVTRIVEGVGSNTGFFSYSCFFDTWSDLVCVHKDSTVLFVNELPFANYCVPFVAAGLIQPDSDEPGCQVYPNPASSVITIAFDNSREAEATMVTAVDAMGRKMAPEMMLQGNLIVVDITTLPEGFLYLLIQNEQTRVVRKVIVERH